MTVTDNEWAQREQDLQAAKAAIAGPVPLIPSPPHCIKELPRGLFMNGEWKTTAEVRELTGLDEEALARTREPVDFFDAVIGRGVVRIGDYDLSTLPTAERQARLQELLIGERDQLFLEIVRATYGDTKVLNFTCGTCRVDQEIELVFSEDFKPRHVENPQQTLFNHVTTRGDQIEYRPATGTDQMEALRKKGSTTAEQNTTILSRCIVKVNGQLVVDPVGYARGLSMRDRQELLDSLIALQPDVDLSVTTTCSACGASQVLSVGWGDLFRL